MTDQNVTVGFIVIPRDLIASSGVLYGNFTVFPEYDRGDLGLVTLDLTLRDQQGNLVTRLGQSLEICLNEPKVKKPPCLAYFDEPKQKWLCEDYCLRSYETTYCGQTGRQSNEEKTITNMKKVT